MTAIKPTYQFLEQQVRQYHPNKVLMRVQDMEAGEHWILRLEQKQGLLIGQRYVPEMADSTLLRKVCDYNYVALQMLCSDILASTSTPYRITGITIE
jgi:hypothetical protein